MAGLLPVEKNGKVNKDELYVVYAGTDPNLLADSGADVGEDLKILGAKLGGGLRTAPTKEEREIYGDLDTKVVGFGDYVPPDVIINPITQSKEKIKKITEFSDLFYYYLVLF